MIVATKKKEIERKWFLFDARGKILGRLASEIATVLIGKSKPYFVKNLDCGDYVVVINANQIKVSGRKATNKVYTHYSGYPAGLKKESFEQLLKRKPEEIIIRAIKGMLPKNKLQDRWLTKLYVYRDEKHPYADKLKNK